MNIQKSITVHRQKRGFACDRVLATANGLFYRQGIRAVGVDQIVKIANVAKISMYRTFPYKHDLTEADLQDRDVAFWRFWDNAIAEVEDAEDQLKAALNNPRTSIAAPGYRGVRSPTSVPNKFGVSQTTQDQLSAGDAPTWSAEALPTAQRI